MFTEAFERNFLFGVFTEGFPGLQLANLGLLAQPIQAIDWHAPLDLAEARQALIDLRDKVLRPNGLLLDAVVFGLKDEDYAGGPAAARRTVGFAGLGQPEREERFLYVKQLAELVAELLPADLFVRNRITLKGHFGAFDRNAGAEYEHLVACLKKLRAETLLPKKMLMLAETGCESADDVIALIREIGIDTFGANWDTANLLLWGVVFDNLEYGRALSEAGVLRGIHVKGGKASADPGKTWGTEVNPDSNMLIDVMAILQSCTSFDGAVIAEREMFLPADAGSKETKRESQQAKAMGLSMTLRDLRLIHNALNCAIRSQTRT